MSNIEIDPDLEFQLDAAKEGELVEAVLLLRAGSAEQPADVDALLGRVCDRSAEPLDSNYMPRIRALLVRARPEVIRKLISQPEVEMASANQLEGDEEIAE